MVIDHGVSGVGLADQRKLCKPAELADEVGGHVVGTHAVKAHGGSAPVLQLLHQRAGILSAKQVAAGLHGKGNHGGTGPFQLGGGENGLCLLGVEQGLAHQKVSSAIDEAADLAAVVFHHQVKIVRIPAVAVGCQCGNVTGNQALRSGGAGQGNQLGVDGLAMVLQADFFQGNGLPGRWGRR